MKTTVYLLRLRYHLTTDSRGATGAQISRATLAEECIAIAVRGADDVAALTETEALALLELEPGRNMEQSQKTRLVGEALERLPKLDGALRDVVCKRAEKLLADHRRVREASDVKGLRYRVAPAFPFDVIGAYVLLPMAQA